MTAQSKFMQLHVPGKPFVLANAWDIGSARMLQALGAKAVATSSAAHAFTLGKADLGHVTREEAVDHAAELARSLKVPVSGDFENGYGHSPDEVATTITLAAKAGVQGGSIEDIMAPAETPYDFDKAVKRIEAAVAAIRRLGKEFVLTARADGVMYGQYDLKEGIRRLQAFETAGADVLYIPMPADMDAIAKICRSVGAPVNALAAGQFLDHTQAEFANAGVARISLGSSLARVIHQSIYTCGKEIFEQGTFKSMANGMGGDAVDKLIL
jgi:2-methylisocitrate lyase-like PEP mutase family enzyme